MTARTVEARIERLEAVRRNAVEATNPPRNGIVVASDHPDDESLSAAVDAEWAKPSTVGVTRLVFIAAEDGRPMQR